VTPLVFALLAAGANVAGGLAVTRSAKRGLAFIEGLVAFGAGYMLSIALTEMVPHALELGGGGAAGVVLLGYLLVHLSQHTLTPHFHFGEETHAVSRAAGVSALIGLLLHTFFDGVAIASGFAVSGGLGVLLFIAIFLHKLPEGVTISSIQVAGGTAPHRALGSAALLGAATVLGVLATSYVGALARHGLALSAGVTIYVGASNLVPEFQGKRGWRLPAAFFLGAAVFFVFREVVARLLQSA
jgi:ZIP family zinc transporter/zinc and cadmium transporter